MALPGRCVCYALSFSSFNKLWSLSDVLNVSVTIHPLQQMSEWFWALEMFTWMFSSPVGLRKQSLMRHRADAGSNLKALYDVPGRENGGGRQTSPSPKMGMQTLQTSLPESVALAAQFDCCCGFHLWILSTHSAWSKKNTKTESLKSYLRGQVNATSCVAIIKLFVCQSK